MYNGMCFDGIFSTGKGAPKPDAVDKSLYNICIYIVYPIHVSTSFPNLLIPVFYARHSLTECNWVIELQMVYKAEYFTQSAGRLTL